MRSKAVDQAISRFPFLIFVLAAILFSSIAVFAGDDVRQPVTEDVRQLVKQAAKQTRKGRFAEAEKILRGVVERNPSATEAKLDLAYVLLKQKQILEAYEISFEIAKNESTNSRAFAILGATLLSAGNFQQAKPLLINSIRLNRKEALAWAGLGMLDFYENRIESAINNLNNATYFDSDEPDFIFALAQVAARAEQYNNAAEAYQRFLSIAPQSDRDRRDRIMGLITFLRFLGTKPKLYDVEGERAKVGVELVKDRPVIRLYVNGHDEPLRFVLDTGSGITVVSKETADRLKIRPVTKGGMARAIGGDGRFQIIYGFLRKVSIGDVKVKNVPVYIRDFHSNSEQIDGYIGLSLISKFLTTIDYGDKTFSLIKKELQDSDFAGSAELFLPLRLTSSGFLSGEVQLEGLEDSLNFIVDTGASVSVISDEVASTEGISRFLRNERMRVVGAAGVTEDVRSFLLPRVTFGGNHTRESITAIELDLDIINEASGFQQAGILGGNFLKNYRLTFDFKNSKVIFTPHGK